MKKFISFNSKYIGIFYRFGRFGGKCRREIQVRRKGARSDRAGAFQAIGGEANIRNVSSLSAVGKVDENIQF